MTARSRPAWWIALAVTAAAIIALAILATARSSQQEQVSNQRVLQTRQISDTLRDMLLHVEDAETGQRGYLLTGRPHYLAPFFQGRSLAPSDLDRLQSTTRDSPMQQAQVDRLRPMVTAKLAELQQTIDLYQQGHATRSLKVVISGQGQHLMEGIRLEISQMQAAQFSLLSARLRASDHASRQTFLWVRGLLGLAVLLLGVAGWSMASLVRQQTKSEERIGDYNLVLEFQKGELEKANAELAALATTDGLTGLKNHRAFQERLAEEAGRAARYGLPLSVVLLDVDRFKQYNDAYGHPAGDAVLKAVARILQGMTRAIDLAARYGGEEFILILPQTDSQGATAFAERVRTALEEYAWAQRTVTASFGVACLRPGDQSGAALIARADEALYHSKAAGRNRVTCDSNSRSISELEV